MIVQLLLTGNELMSGDIVDSNSALIAQYFTESGIAIHLKTTVGDNLQQLVDNIQRISKQSDILLINGGLGPTIDDMTAKALAIATNDALIENSSALKHLSAWCKQRGLTMNQANRKQTILPGKCEIIPNPTGSAVGFYLWRENCLIICTPGVPGELRHMLNDTIIPLIQNTFPDIQPVSTTRLQAFGIGESTFQQMINENLPDWPDEIELGFRAGAPLLEIKLTSHNSQEIEQKMLFVDKVKSLLGDHYIGENNSTLPRTLIKLLTASGKTLTTAESCTGGLIASMLTEVPGASAVFEAGFVSYSNAMKQKLLDVSAQTLAQFGAVSEAVVLEMARGALAKSGADYAIAVSGIAGPDGGSEEKPTGTVWIAWGSKDHLQSRQFLLRYPRKLFQTMSAATGLDLIRRELCQSKGTPLYFKDKSPR
jgi:nicotinamide-nucleotide amidase